MEPLCRRVVRCQDSTLNAQERAPSREMLPVSDLRDKGDQIEALASCEGLKSSQAKAVEIQPRIRPIP